MGLTSRATSIALVSALVYYVSLRSASLWTFYANHPSRLHSISNVEYEIKFADVVRNCEDVVLDEKNALALLSCDPGRDKWNTVMGTFVDPNDSRGTIYAFAYTDPSSTPKPLPLLKVLATIPKAIHPLGVNLHPPSRTLAVISHAEPPSILLFTLSPSGDSATFLTRIMHPSLISPNSLTFLSETELLVTNDHRFTAASWPLLSKMETYLAYPGGSVLYVKLSSTSPGASADVGTKVLTHIPFANGIAILPSSDDGPRVAVASSAATEIRVYDLIRSDSSAAPTLRLNVTVSVPFLPDNLRVDSAGTLLIAGHPYAPALEAVAKGNRFHDLDGAGDAELKPLGERPRAPSWLAEWDGNAEGKTRDLYVGTEFGTSSGPARDARRGVGILTGLYERGIMVWKDQGGK